MTTTKQRTVLATVAELTQRQGFPPTVRELQLELGLASPSTIFHHLELLREQGLVTWEPGKNRTLKLTQRGAQ